MTPSVDRGVRLLLIKNIFFLRTVSEKRSRLQYVTGLALPRCICGLIGCTVHNHLLVLYDGWAQNTCYIAWCQVPSVPSPTVSPHTAILDRRGSWLRTTRESKTAWTGHRWVQSSLVPSIVVGGGGGIIDGHMAIFISFKHVI